MAVQYVVEGYVAEKYYQVGITIDWKTFVINIPRLFLVQIQTTPVKVYNLDLDLLRKALKDIEDSSEGMAYPDTHTHNTGVEVGGVILSRVIQIQDPYTITFEDDQYAVNLIGANSNVADRVNVNQVSVRSANSAGLQDLSTLLAAAYQGQVVIDVLNGQTGTARPIGTYGTPSNNLTDARTILDTEGLDTFKIQGDLILTSGDFSDGVTFEGRNAVTSTVLITEAADVTFCEFRELTITGTVDDNNVLRDCIVSNVTSHECLLRSCGLTGTLTLGGTGGTVMKSSSSLTGVASIDIGSGSSLNVSSHTGDLTILNKTGTDVTSIGMASGIIIIDATCTTGEIEIEGIGSLVDNSGPGCHVIDRLMDSKKLDNLEPFVEMTRVSHGVIGKVIYWDPYKGDDTFDGIHKNRGMKTFAAAQALATAGAHDLIIGVSTDPAGETIVDENITISKESLHVRALARSFHLKPTSTTLPAVNIIANGVELNGFRISTPTTCTAYAVEVDNVYNTLIDNDWIYEGGKGVRIYGNSRDTALRNTRIAHNTGNGVSVEDTSEHTDIENCHISSNTGAGVEVSGSGHEVSIAEKSVLHSNGTYGVDISAVSTGVHILENVTIYGNGIEDVRDLATNTYDASLETEKKVWGVDKSTFTDTSSIGYYVSKKLISIAKFLALK